MHPSIAQAKEAAGEIYNKWKQTTRKSIGGADSADSMGGRSERMPLPQTHKEKHLNKLRAKSSARDRLTGGDGKQLHSELKSVSQIRKEREKKEHVRVANLPQDKRKAAINKLKDQYKEKQAAKRTEMVARRALGGGGKGKGNKKRKR